MRLRDPRTWLALVSLGLVLWLFALDWGSTSPGPLSAVHAQLGELEGAEGCEGCHVSLGAELAEGCLDCHEPIADQLAQGRGFHAAGLDEGVRRDCELCHPEHHGPQVELAGDAAFRLAGWSARADFDHRHVDFVLSGAHAELECSTCHEQADAALLQPGQARFSGLEQGCAACHDDPHEGRFVSGCAECHGQERPFGEVASFVHGSSFPLRGAHARPTCAECHEPGSAYEVEALAGSHAPPPARDCQACHESPHRPTFPDALAARLQVAPGQTCAACHDAERESFAGEAALLPAELHVASGFALAAPHAELACASCHAGDHAAQVRLPVRSPFDCAACHDDPHTDQFRSAAFASAACLDCHDRERFTPTHLSVADHARTGFPLEQAHARVDCAACHVEPAPGAPRVYSGTPSECAACHPEGHEVSLGGAFADARSARDCAGCHAPTRFADVDVEAFDHLSWTAFALEGGHARADCKACHVPEAATRRQLGRVSAAFTGALDTCAGCHADAHRGAFGSSDCAACHSTAGFGGEHLLAAFEHGPRTGFALEGAHRRADCASCHREGPAPAAVVPGRLASRRRLGFAGEHMRGDGPGCSACHDDPHGELFAERAALDPLDVAASCAACHDLETFARLDAERFDHGRWTSFALVGAHARSACAACHAGAGEPLPGMPGLRPSPGRTCASCHEDPHAGQFADRRGGTSDCAACHREDADFKSLVFDHERDSRFALEKDHSKLACSACHVEWPLKDGRRVVRYKPLPTLCIDCHDHGGRQGGGKKP